MFKSIPQKFWQSIQHLFSVSPNQPGRRVKNPRKVLAGIFFITKGGIPWRMLPRRYGAASTVHGLFIKWSKAKIFDEIHKILVAEYLAKHNPTYLAIDAALQRMRHGGSGGGKNPCDRAKNGVKRTVVSDDRGAPLICHTSPANQHDIIPARAVLCQIKALSNLTEITVLAADSGYDSTDFKDALMQANITPLITPNKRRGKEKASQEATSKKRWIIESVHSQMNNFRSLIIRYAKHDFAYQALCSFACAAMIFNKL